MFLAAVLPPLRRPLALLILPLIIAFDASTLPADRSQGASLGFGPRYCDSYGPPVFDYKMEANGALRAPLRADHERGDISGCVFPHPRNGGFVWDVTFDTYDTTLRFSGDGSGLTDQQLVTLRLRVAEDLEFKGQVTPQFARWMREDRRSVTVYHPTAYIHNAIACMLFAALAYALGWQLLVGIAGSISAKHIARCERRAAKGLCAVCEYDLTGVNAPRCPECGCLKW